MSLYYLTAVETFRPDVLGQEQVVVFNLSKKETDMSWPRSRPLAMLRVSSSRRPLWRFRRATTDSSPPTASGLAARQGGSSRRTLTRISDRYWESYFHHDGPQREYYTVIALSSTRWVASPPASSSGSYTATSSAPVTSSPTRISTSSRKG